MGRSFIPSEMQHSSIGSKKTVKNAVLSARKRAIEARKKASFGNSSSGYEFEGWQSLMEDYVKSPKLSLKNPSAIDSVKSDSQQNQVVRNQKKIAETTLCPSAQADIDDAVVFGVVGGTVESPRVNYLERSQPVDEKIQQLSAPSKSTEMMRVASPCQEKGCLHFDGSDCRLATRIVERLPTVTETLPACQIRSSCRWWQQKGKSACLRCPQVVTENYYSPPLLERLADPSPSR